MSEEEREDSDQYKHIKFRAGRAQKHISRIGGQGKIFFFSDFYFL